MFRPTDVPLTLTKRYFVNRDGIPTTRMQSAPGKSHYEVASAVERLVPGTDFYDQMFALKYIRVGEDVTTKTLHVDAPVASPDKLTNLQRRWVKDMQAAGWTLSFNSREFLESRDAKVIVNKLLQ